MSLLNFERSGIDYVAWARRTLDDLTGYASNASSPDGGSLIDDPVASARFAELGVEIDAARLMTYEVAWLQGQGEAPSVEPAMSKLSATEVNQRVHDFAVEWLGMYGPLAPGSPLAEFEGMLLKLRLFYTSGPILSGTKRNPAKHHRHPRIGFAAGIGGGVYSNDGRSRSRNQIRMCSGPRSPMGKTKQWISV